MNAVGVFLTLVFAYSLASERLGRTPLTAPMLFTAAGALAAWLAPRRRVRTAPPCLSIDRIGP